MNDEVMRLYGVYGRLLYKYCLRRLRDREAAEDAVQTIFVNVLRSLRKGVQPRHEQAWLFAIAQRVCMGHYERSHRRQQREVAIDLVAERPTLNTQDVRDRLAEVHRALDRLTEGQRTAIVLRDWRGLSYSEISEVLGLSQSATTSLIFRAREAIAEATAA